MAPLFQVAYALDYSHMNGFSLTAPYQIVCHSQKEGWTVFQSPLEIKSLQFE